MMIRHDKWHLVGHKFPSKGAYNIKDLLTLVHVVVFPLPCRPTNIITLFLPFVGVHGFTPEKHPLLIPLGIGEEIRHYAYMMS